jgi:hypothetical protein
MAVFEIHCGRVDLVVKITYGGVEAPGNAEYRGFPCSHAGECQQAGIECQLFTQRGYRPFEVADAFEHFNS